ncbi:uncharacterized protein EV422DRAFT_483160, partial [Fimicolochytrium jonesii]|uniref:uncharacterized protein n=1 Tax=Fimicolochytrium jonesii TaxID=1396493 RepID=UPI0022FE9128
ENALSLAHTFYNKSDYTSAYNILSQLHAFNATHLPTLLLLGCTCYSLNMHQLSLYYNECILGIDPGFAEAFSNLGTTYRVSGRDCLSVWGFELSGGWTPGRRRDLYYAKASLMYSLNNIDAAKWEYIKGLLAIGLALYDTFVQAASGTLPQPMVTPHLALSALHQQMMCKGLKTNVEFNATASGMLQTLAKIYQDQQQVPLAVSLYYVALGILPNANTCNNIGILLASQRLSEAVTWYEFGLTLEQGHVHLLTNLGSALKDRGMVQEGINCYLRAITIQPDFFIALANLANVYKDLSRVEEAIELYRRALEVKPDFVEAFCNYVNSLLFVCQWEGRG